MNICQKIRYNCELAALADLSRLLANTSEPAHRKALLQAYPCPACDGWHIGHRTAIDEARA